MLDAACRRPSELSLHRAHGNEGDDTILELSEVRVVTLQKLGPNLEAKSSSTQTMTDENAVPLYKDRRRRIVLAGIMVAWLFKGFDDTVITTIAPALCRKFDSLPDVAWFSAAYFFPQACLAIGFGKLAAGASLRWFAVIDGAALTVGSILCIVARSSAVFILGRAVTGLGIAAGFPLCTMVIIDITTPAERPIYMACCVGIDVISLALGALLGGFFETRIDYRWTFVLTIFGSILFVSIIILAYEQPRRDSLPMALYIRQFDYSGFFLLLTFSLTLLIGIQLAAQDNNWTATPVVALLALAAAALPCFVIQQINGHPTNRFLPRGLFTRDVVLLLGFGFFVLFAMYGVYYYLSTWLQTVKGLSSFDAAVWLLAFFLASGLSSILTGVSMIWIPYANIIILPAATLVLVGTFALTSLTEHTTTLHASLISIISGIGCGSSQTLAIIFSQTWVPKLHQSFVVSVALMVQIFGGTLGLVVGGSVLNTQLVYLDNGVNGTQAFAKSIQAVFYVCAAAATMAFLLAILMKWHKIRTDESDVEE